MSKFAVRLLTLAIYATSLALVPLVAPAKAETSSGKHVKKHKSKVQWSRRTSGPWSANQAWPNQAWRGYGPAGQPEPACSGSGRSFECRTWPPPFDEDPDRKASATDGGN